MTNVPLAPYAPEWLEMEKSLGGRSVFRGSIEEQRSQFAKLGATLGPLFPPLPDVLDTQDILITSTLKIRVYAPKDNQGELPFGLYFHCGGFVMGSIESDDYFCRVIAMSTPSVVVSVEYRLAPEHKFPAAHTDAKDAFEWAFSNIAKYGASPSKGYAIGQSAGANLAISLALSLKSSSRPNRIKGVVAVVPATIASSAIPSNLASSFNGAENADSAVIDAAAVDQYVSSYDPPRDSSEFSVLLSKDISLLPPTYIVACGKDPLRDDALIFKKHLEEESVKTKLDYYEGFPHMFWMIPGLAMGDTAVKNIISGTKWVISTMS